MKIKPNANYSMEGYGKLKGKVIHIYTSLAGLRCVHINNFYLTRLIDDITLDETNL